MIAVGVDIGSITTKTVVLEDGKTIVSNIIRTGANSKQSATRSLNMALSNIGISRDDMDYVVATGYGRANLELADKCITEITCHGIGACHLFPGTRTVIDIGGQDSKAISLSEKGEVLDFVMNDKCAAGTGRFLEVMAGALEVELDRLGRISLLAKKVVEISSMCTVFAESEVVSLIAEGCPKEDIARGLHNAIAERVLSMANKIGILEPVTLSGGVIKNIGVVNAIKGKLGLKVNVPEDPQIVGALGASLVAHRYCLSSPTIKDIYQYGIKSDYHK